MKNNGSAPSGGACRSRRIPRAANAERAVAFGLGNSNPLLVFFSLQMAGDRSQEIRKESGKVNPGVQNGEPIFFIDSKKI